MFRFEKQVCENLTPIATGGKPCTLLLRANETVTINTVSGSGRLVLSCTDTTSGDTIVENAVIFDSNAFFFVKPGEEIELNHQIRGDPNLMYAITVQHGDGLKVTHPTHSRYSSPPHTARRTPRTSHRTSPANRQFSRAACYPTTRKPQPVTHNPTTFPPLKVNMTHSFFFNQSERIYQPRGDDELQLNGAGGTLQSLHTFAHSNTRRLAPRLVPLMPPNRASTDQSETAAGR